MTNGQILSPKAWAEHDKMEEMARRAELQGGVAPAPSRPRRILEALR